MQIVLGKKQNIANDLWREVLRDIRSLVTRRELDALVYGTLRRAEKDLRGLKCIYAWSGGKDATVCADLSLRLGVSTGSLIHTNLEYPEFMTWAMRNLPSGCSPVCTGQDMTWLRNNMRYLFPKDSATLGRTYAIVQRAGNRKRMRELGADRVITGRRKADGNCPGVSGYYDIIFDWPHEAVLAYHVYYDLPFAPIYDWPDGFRQGTHSWPFRYARGKTDDDMWREIYRIDPSVVAAAAECFDDAARILDAMR